MTEPTRDEINRALAEWEGWNYYIDPGARNADPVKEPGGWWENARGKGSYGSCPDYCSSLDAQMPLWGKVGESGSYVMLMGGKPAVAGVYWDTDWHKGASPAEASARALYAVLEAMK